MLSCGAAQAGEPLGFQPANLNVFDSAIADALDKCPYGEYYPIY